MRLNRPKCGQPKHWDDDVFHDRRRYGRLLRKLLFMDDEPLTVSVEGPWGGGKTEFLNMFGTELREEGIKCVHIDAWKGSLVGDPLSAIVSSILGEVISDKSSQGIEVKVEQVKKRAKRASVLLLRNLLSKVTLEAVGDNVQKALLGEYDIPDAIWDYHRSIEIVEDVRTSLETLIVEVGVGEIVLIVDELDRCRPEYALLYVETIVHFLEISGLKCILAVDYQQLEGMLTTIYGKSCKPDEYLRKVIDYRLELPQENKRLYVQHCSSVRGIQKIFTDSGYDQSQVQASIEIFGRYAEYLGMSLRTIDAFINALALLLVSSSPRNNPFPSVFIVLYVLHWKYGNQVRTMGAGRVAECIDSELLPIISNRVHDDTMIRHVAYLHVLSKIILMSPEEYQQYLSSLDCTFEAPDCAINNHIVRISRESIRSKDSAETSIRFNQSGLEFNVS